MSENRYQKLLGRIHAPDELSGRVLAAARRSAEKQASGSRRRTPGRRRPVLRGAVCAACALALVLGTWNQRSVRESAEERDPTALPVFTFGLTAYAADTGERVAPNANGGLAFRAEGEGSWSEGGGYYTGCLFQVTGEGIETVSLTIDRGGLYLYQVHTDLTEEEIAGYRQEMEEGALAPAAISQAEDGSWYMPEMSAPEASLTGDYDPQVSYGLWSSGADAAAWRTDPRAASQESIDQLDGARLTVEITFADGSTQSKLYRLSTGRLRVIQDGRGGGTLLPQLAGDDEPCIYGVYAESETEGRWLEWPVQGANTVRTSNSFGGRWQPGGESLVFHYGIDIPADAGTPILAAADGTVAEIGFDRERGNYIVLDHGGGLETLYGQCQDLPDSLEKGDTVSAGEVIGAVGSTGLSTGPHLHFEVCQDGEPQNPEVYFPSAVRDTLRAA